MIKIGCNPFIQVLSEKCILGHGIERARVFVVIPLFRSYRKNVQLNLESWKYFTEL